MEDEWNEDQALQECQKEISALVKDLPEVVDPAELTLKSKMPFKVMSLSELLRHRLGDLVQAALDMYRSTQVIPAFVLTRACLESSSLHYLLLAKVGRFMKDGNAEALDQFLARALLGSRDGEHTHPAINVLDAIDRVDKEYVGFRGMYDGLSEYTHPNQRGVLGSYAKFDDVKGRLEIGRLKSKISKAIGLAPLLMSVSIFANCYNELEAMIPRLNQHFEGTA